MGETGLSGVTMRSIAKRLGGTVTMVTHYYPTRQSILDDVRPALLARWQSDLDSLDAIPNPRAALRATLCWMVPLDEENSLVEERAWMAMLAAADSDTIAVAAKLHDEMDTWMREIIRDHLKELVEPDRRERVVDVLRTTTHGITVSAIEDSSAWPSERQVAVIDELLAALIPW
jgi:AcrR family transcriptional regulator